MKTLSLKSKVRVFVGVPNLTTNDRYSGYLPSVLSHLKAQITTAKIMPTYVTPPHSGKFQHGMPDRLDALVGRMNNIIEKFMTTDATHVFFCDGDVEIPPDCIDTLLRHNVDLASGVYPFHNFTKRTEDGVAARAMMFGRIVKDNPCGLFHPRDWDFMKGQVWGEEDAWTGGTGCFLVKRRVFKDYPHVKPLRFRRTRECGSMDMLLWKQAQDIGFTARVDANIVCGHLPLYKLSEIDEWLV